MCFIRPYYSETKNKIGRENGLLGGSQEEEKKKTTRNGIASQPLSTIYPSQLALNSWSELWVTLSTTCSALRVKEGPFWFLTGKVTITVAVLTSRRPHSSQGSVSSHPRCDYEKGQQKTNSLWQASSRKRKEKKKRERKRKRTKEKKRDY